MKKLLASILVSILAAGGYVFVDSSIQGRVETLEKEAASIQAEASSLREEVSALQEAVSSATPTSGYKVGDNIPCFPKSTFTLNESGQTITVTDFSAKITQDFTKTATSFVESSYPYRGIATIKGNAGTANAGKLIYFYLPANDNCERVYTYDGCTINSDGTFEAAIPLYIIRSGAAFNLRSFIIADIGDYPRW